MNKLIRNVFICKVSLLLISCGLKGPLYLPKDEISSGNKKDINTIINKDKSKINKNTESNLLESNKN